MHYGCGFMGVDLTEMLKINGRINYAGTVQNRHNVYLSTKATKTAGLIINRQNITK